MGVPKTTFGKRWTYCEYCELACHGADETHPNTVSLQSYVEAVTKAVLNYPEKVILVGHSMAGIVVSQVAENLPHRIQRLVYISAYLPQDGEDLLSLSKQDSESLIGFNLEFAPDYSVASIKKEVLAEAICADASEDFKTMLVQYHKAEPTKPLSEAVHLTDAKFGLVEKWYIHSTNDKAVGYKLQEQMVQANGKIARTFLLATSHLPFVVKAQEVFKILIS